MINISYADLTHTGQSVSANTIPRGVSMVAAYAKKQFGNNISNEIFRYPEDLNTYLKKNNPQIACFSALSWNMELSHTFAKYIKLNSKNAITIFGGPNFPVTDEEQKNYLKEKYPYIDFFIEGEGELAFVELFKNLESFDFNHKKLKERRTIVPNVRYVYEDSFVTSDALPRIKDLDIVPSIYLDGMSDKFFDEYLSPTIETMRGCPYKCTFCVFGSTHWTKVGRNSMDRIKAEIDYIAKRAKVGELQICDQNFGIVKEDIETAKAIAKAQDEYGWPNFISQASAKNNKEHIVEIASILKGKTFVTGSVQSTDPTVLKLINRRNLPFNELAKISKDFAVGNISRTEVILGLPGDTKEAHFKTNFDLIECGFNLIRNHQLMLFEGSEDDTKESREKFDMKSLFHIQPRCFGSYEIYDKKNFIGEIEENLVSSNTLSYEDYLECRLFDLTIEIFLNDAIFDDLTQYLIQKNISRAKFIENIHLEATQINSTISKIYVDYKTEEKNNFWSNRKDLENFIKKEDSINRYISGELGTNEIYKYRSIAIFYHMEELHKIAYKVAKSLLGPLSEIEKIYLDELYEFSLIRKKECFNLDVENSKAFNFDFINLQRNNFRINPLNSFSKVKHEIKATHSDWQKDNIKTLEKQYGGSLLGLLRIISRSHVSDFYRSVTAV